MSSPLLAVKQLTVTLNNGNKLLDDISFTVNHHKCLGIVGESGSGKSLTCKAIIGLLESYFSVTGQILFKQANSTLDLLKQNKKTLRPIRGSAISIILQQPMIAFDPLYCIGKQVVETLQAHLTINKNDAIARTLLMIENIGLDNAKEIYKKYPHQLSGGMLQRIMIGMALVLEPELIIADEPTTALDSISQFYILKMLEEIKSKTTMIFISHDLGVIHHIANDIIVMNKGKIVESGSRDQIFYHPKHEYTRYLIDTRKQLLNKFNTVIYANNPNLISETI
ncbi:ABC transporter ATP-binding protein [Gilliamella sp. ESL0443]|uniref:ABC transporter ATP-binding protein n=1 Tax=Gilliamella sp. ESL0443 TaxID=2704655 RepID=UPI001C6992A8|nr:ABC transporter ATP-binding protein [Gilliamella sp. ESL0443]QYN42011.1 ABC transporter ATP-binding protein [Gilliamella sp. ESL0443]